MDSFTRQVKSEVARQPIKELCCALAELKAFLQMSGSITTGRDRLAIGVVTENTPVARRLFLLFKKAFKTSPEIYLYRNQRLQKAHRFLLQFPSRDVSLKVLKKLGFTEEEEGLSGFALASPASQRLETGKIKKKCCRRSYLRGAFLSSGYLNNPQRDYHLEIIAHCEEHAGAVKDVLESFNLPVRHFERKGDTVLYIKGGEKISEFLRIIAAHSSLLGFENIRVWKGVKNRINRIVNCETANLTRTVQASQEQIESIQLVQQVIGLENISSSLREAALLRLRFPEATLQELGDVATPPLSKSSMNHRLRRLGSMARKIKEGKKEL